MASPNAPPDLAAAIAFVVPSAPLAGSKAAPAPSATASRSSLAGLSMRDLVQRLAAERGLSFLPKANRATADGKSLYSLGGMTLYIEQDVVFVLTNGKYAPMALDDLLQKAAAES